MLVRVLGAEFDLQRAIAESGSALSNLADAAGQLTRLAMLQREIRNATSANIIDLKSVVAAIVTATETIAENTRSGVTASGRLSEREQLARDNVVRIADAYYRQRVLDPYLVFASEEDEAEYRARERRNREAIERELAKGTPEGDRKAAEIMRAQLLDARDHGADASPDFERLFNQNKTAIDTYSTSIPLEPAARGTGAPEPANAGAGSGELDDIRAALAAAGATPLRNQADQPCGPSAAPSGCDGSKGTKRL